jgi:glucose-6-phosphate 1-epimerase
VQPPPADLQGATFDYLQHCQEQYGRPGLIEFSAGAGGLPRATLLHPCGARAELYLHGAAVTSWRHSDGRELLHLRDGNAFDGEQPIK